jgi:ribosomal protein S18 acetylase RimI-like enzyme
MCQKYRIDSIQATIDDIEFLIDLRNETMVEHFRNTNLPHTPENIRERVLYRLDCAKILSINQERVGMVKVIKEGNIWELCQIQITSKFQRKGIGYIVISEILTEARKKGVQLKLNVLKANPAKKLYERLGFVVIKDGNHFYEMSTL